jgi:DNA replication protein DnaC
MAEQINPPPRAENHQPTRSMKTDTNTTAEPQPVNPFTIFAQSRPQLPAIAERLRIQINETTISTFFFLQAGIRLLQEQPPALTNAEGLKSNSIVILNQQIKNPELTKEGRQALSEEMLGLLDEIQAPRKKHAAEIKRISEFLAAEEKAYSEWIAFDPEGISADQAAKKYADHQRAKEIAQDHARKAEEAKRRRAAAVEKNMDHLSCEVGPELTQRINPTHPNFDWITFRAFARWWPVEWHNSAPMNVVLVGDPNTGKSRALAYKAQQIIRRHPYHDSAWITGANFADLVSGLSHAETRSDCREKLRRLKDADFLFFDDLGTANFTSSRLSHFFALVDSRYNERKRATLFSTNHSLEVIRTMLAKASESQTEGLHFANRIIRRLVGTANDPRAEAFHFKTRESK